MRTVVAGAIALQSVYTICSFVSFRASATRAATDSAAAGTRIHITSEASRTRSEYVGTSSIPAISASLRVRSLRPFRQVITRAPEAIATCPTTWPISPGLSRPTVKVDIGISFLTKIDLSTTYTDCLWETGYPAQVAVVWIFLFHHYKQFLPPVDTPLPVGSTPFEALTPGHGHQHRP